MLRSRTQLVVPVLLTLILPTVLGAAPLTPRLLGVKFKDGGAAKDDDKISAIRADVVAALEKVDDAVRALPANGEASLQSSVRLEIANLSESIGALRREVRTTPNLEPLLAELERTRTGLERAASTLDTAALAYGRLVTRLTDAVNTLRDALGLAVQDPPPVMPDALALSCNALLLTPPRDDRPPSLDSIVTDKEKVEEYLKSRKIATGDFFANDLRDRALALAGVCARLLQEEAADLPDTETPEVHAALVESQWSISILGKWGKALSKQKGAPTPELVTRSTRQLVEAERAVDQQMGAHALDRMVSAGLFVGTMVGGSGRRLTPQTNDPDELSLKETPSTVPVALLNIETKHWGALGPHTVDLSFRSVAGFKSVLVPLLATGVKKDATSVVTTRTTAANGSTITETTTTATETQLKAVPTTALQEAFVFGIGGRVGAYSSRGGFEVSLVGLAVGSTIWNDQLLMEAGNTDAVVGRPANNASRTEWAYEVGPELKLFDNPIRVAHAEGGMVSPALTIAAGYRYDTRLRPTGALASEALGLRNSEGRLYFRVMWDPIKNLFPRETAAPAKPFDLGVGVESDSPAWGQGATSIPRNTRFIIRGDINLLRVGFKESGDKK